MLKYSIFVQLITYITNIFYIFGFTLSPLLHYYLTQIEK